MMHPIHLSSDRLFYRTFLPEDFPVFSSIFTNQTVMRYTVIDCYTSLQDLKIYFDQILHNNSAEIQNRIAYEFAVFQKDTQRLIGFADVEIQSRNPHGGEGELGYLLLPESWGNGYATEISRTLCTFCFEDIALHRVIARCDSRNRASENIMKKIGMKQEGIFRQSRFKDYQWQDELRYALLLDEWQSAQRL